MKKTRKQHRDDAAKQWFFNRCLVMADLRAKAKKGAK